MCADTKTNVYDRNMPGVARKIARLRAHDETLLVGVSGNAGMVGRIRAGWDPDAVPAPPRGPVDVTQEWADEVAGMLTRPILDAAMVDSEGRMDGHLLLGAAGQVWTVFHHAAIWHPDGVAAVGSGEGLVIGAMDVLLGRPGWQPATALVEAVEVACRRDQWSGLPLQVEMIGP